MSITAILWTLLTIALLALPILLLVGVITTTFIWNLACGSLGLGLTISTILILIEIFSDYAGEETEGAAGLLSIVVALILIVPSAGILIILWLLGRMPEWFNDLSAVQIGAWVFLALFFIGLIGSVISLLSKPK